jgi:inorganic pyrophosphatase
MSYRDIPIGEKNPEMVNVVVEIPRGTYNKYEYDDGYDVLRLDRVLHSPFFYPVDYGFIPETVAEDGDHLDVLTITDSPTFPGCLIRVRPLAVLKMSDEKGRDNKILAVPQDHPHYRNVKSVKDIEPHILDEIIHFFTEYKRLERKIVKVDGWGTKQEALKAIKEGHDDWKNREDKKKSK